MNVIVVKHPSFPDIQKTVPAAEVDRWLAAGWLKLLTKEQEQRLDEIEAEIDAGVCPTCGASGYEPCRTASGAVAKKPHANRPQ